LVQISALTEDKSDNVKDSFHEDLEHVFPKYHMKMLEDFSA